MPPSSTLPSTPGPRFAAKGDRVCLVIETSNPSVSAEVGIGVLRAADAEMRRVERVREVGRNEDDLMPAIDRACAAAGIGAHDIEVVAVSIGPGGYTALRVACAVGKMIAEVAGGVCVGVPTAACVALGAERVGVRLGVCLAGKGDSTYLTVFERGCWQPTSPMPTGHLVDAASFPFGEVEMIVGDKHVPAAIRAEAIRRGVAIEEPRFGAGACLQIARLIPATDPVLLAPLYPREPDAVTLWRKRHGG